MVDRSPKHAEELDRFRKLHAETTDPLAARLLQDIISELEADLNPQRQETGSKVERG
ncbi:hypothetical protein ABIB75_005405 [Bradyrhizobium sp. GM2.2]|jgi:hypothetical protein|uniref:hypothetical protein n=1 Tax=Bradyrhizobium TaxID=374 RepID=UPI0013C2BBB7|nr:MULTISPECIES: hypothetical protein [Bradyrhizobium]MCK1295361.1 hypothetical protein [Bradyrhizobium sp. 30]MCK1309892.1 hypothetical protein [Bradyrhizobium sp. 45]MCK1434878.1 hypothetical protein [Bradyrhizobium sp. 15]MCK1521714.1 hypothetical protein [Bradyrhizobium sp. 17]MCK1611612.1 hypothetical protein [Bradyrhizobium sp. 163]